MPLVGSATNDDNASLPSVTNDEIAAIVAWILGGALNN